MPSYSHNICLYLQSYPTGPGLSLSPGGMSLPSPNFRPIPILRLSPLGSTPRAACLPSTLAPAKIAATLACSARVHRARARTYTVKYSKMSEVGQAPERRSGLSPASGPLER